ncbi:MAG: hypothetical protein A3G18_08980 [Rhodospirillales bacterium RIFCSPLOWO2_12_FULL_58_28]|nr:MAG: hypothetical protein A3H92_01575 [Rhodospirillales bacterium RIFCSPLOWO2_02_FULL_58_16]OHC78436.1 MAG: hypothetical protein A3G18_08980 [Rhodospirillales bacterium RIFCSPLOWO2_12_FULL_58_28]
MTRFLWLYVLPLVFPAAVYFLWIKLRSREEKEGDEPRKDPWFWLILCGLLLMAASLVLMAASDDNVTSGAYEPDRLENGRIVPGGIKSAPK